jgi:hypothetical protein
VKGIVFFADAHVDAQEELPGGIVSHRDGRNPYVSVKMDVDRPDILVGEKASEIDDGGRTELALPGK